MVFERRAEFAFWFFCCTDFRVCSAVSLLLVFPSSRSRRHICLFWIKPLKLKRNGREENVYLPKTGFPSTVSRAINGQKRVFIYFYFTLDFPSYITLEFRREWEILKFAAIYHFDLNENEDTLSETDVI